MEEAENKLTKLLEEREIREEFESLSYALGITEKDEKQAVYHEMRWFSGLDLIAWDGPVRALAWMNGSLELTRNLGEPNETSRGEVDFNLLRYQKWEMEVTEEEMPRHIQIYTDTVEEMKKPVRHGDSIKEKGYF
jgi:hypothetical protein